MNPIFPSELKSWLPRFQPNPEAELRLFCFPYAGGSSQIFRSWSNSLPPTIEICSLELPGRGSRFLETPFTQLEPLVEAIAFAILPYCDRPFAFFGHSMGALVSFELARILRKKYGLSPVHLFVSGHRAPQIPDPDPPIYALPEAEFIEELRYLKGTPQAVLENTELMELILPILRADFEAIETYSYTQELPLNCPIAVFGGLQDDSVSIQELQAWQQQTSTGFSLKMLPGDHFFIQSCEAILLDALLQAIN